MSHVEKSEQRRTDDNLGTRRRGRLRVKIDGRWPLSQCSRYPRLQTISECGENPDAMTAVNGAAWFQTGVYEIRAL